MHIDVVLINVHKYEAVVIYHIFLVNSTCIVRSAQRDPIWHYHNRREGSKCNTWHKVVRDPVSQMLTESRPTLSCLSKMLTPHYTHTEEKIQHLIHTAMPAMNGRERRKKAKAASSR